MGKIRKPKPVKLFIGFIFKQEPAFKQAKKILEKKFSSIDYESAVFAFDYTDYYREEFGSGLKRQFLSFERLAAAESLAKIKRETNFVEARLSKKGRRLVNIDPGYLNCAKVVLASTKDYSHRIFLGGGIYAELALLYRQKTFIPLEWTYPDYRSNEYKEALLAIRGLYCRQIKR